MRFVIGIIVGIIIVFNWGTIKAMFDSSLTKQGTEISSDKAGATNNQTAKPASAQPAPPAEPKDINAAVEDRLKAIAAGK